MAAQDTVVVDLGEITRELHTRVAKVDVPWGSGTTVEDTIHAVDDVVELALDPTAYCLWTVFTAAAGQTQQTPLDDHDQLEHLPTRFGVNREQLAFVIRRRNLKQELQQMNLTSTTSELADALKAVLEPCRGIMGVFQKATMGSAKADTFKNVLEDVLEGVAILQEELSIKGVLKDYMEECAEELNSGLVTYEALAPFDQTDLEKDRSIEKLRQSLNVSLSRLCVHVYMQVLNLNPQGENPIASVASASPSSDKTNSYSTPVEVKSPATPDSAAQKSDNLSPSTDTAGDEPPVPSESGLVSAASVESATEPSTEEETPSIEAVADTQQPDAPPASTNILSTGSPAEVSTEEEATHVEVVVQQLDTHSDAAVADSVISPCVITEDDNASPTTATAATSISPSSGQAEHTYGETPSSASDSSSQQEKMNQEPATLPAVTEAAAPSLDTSTVSEEGAIDSHDDDDGADDDGHNAEHDGCGPSDSAKQRRKQRKRAKAKAKKQMSRTTSAVNVASSTHDILPQPSNLVTTEVDAEQQLQQEQKTSQARQEGSQAPFEPDDAARTSDQAEPGQNTLLANEEAVSPPVPLQDHTESKNDHEPVPTQPENVTSDSVSTGDENSHETTTADRELNDEDRKREERRRKIEAIKARRQSGAPPLPEQSETSTEPIISSEQSKRTPEPSAPNTLKLIESHETTAESSSTTTVDTHDESADNHKYDERRKRIEAMRAISPKKSDTDASAAIDTDDLVRRREERQKRLAALEAATNAEPRATKAELLARRKQAKESGSAVDVSTEDDTLRRLEERRRKRAEEEAAFAAQLAQAASSSTTDFDKRKQDRKARLEAIDISMASTDSSSWRRSRTSKQDQASPVSAPQSTPRAVAIGAPVGAQAIKPSSAPPSKAAVDISAIEKLLVEASAVQRPVSPKPTKLEQNLSPVFFEHNGRVKKASLSEGDATRASIQAAFESLMQFKTPLPRCTFQLRDPQGFVFYDLDDLSELASGCTLRLVPDVVPDQSLLLRAIAEDIKSMRIDAATKRTTVAVASGASTGTSNDKDGTGSKLETKLRELRRRRMVTIKQQSKAASSLKEEIGSLKSSWLMFEKSMKNDLKKAHRMTQKTKYAIQHMGPSRQLTVEKENVLEKSHKIQEQLDEVKITLTMMRTDVAKRRVRPPKRLVDEIDTSLKSIETGLEQLENDLKEARPRWKKIWEKELQEVVSEQKIIKDHEAKIDELDEQLQNMQELFEVLQKITEKLDKVQPVKVDFLPPDEDMELTDKERRTGLLKQIQMISVDSKKRVEAMDAATKARRLDLASRKDEFKMELGGFVMEKKLKQTGGIQKIEEMRRERDRAIQFGQ